MRIAFVRDSKVIYLLLATLALVLAIAAPESMPWGL
jgi:hypothetical protein